MIRPICLSMFVALMLAGCASVEVGRAQALAKAGLQGSDALESAAAQTEDAFLAHRRAEDLQDAVLNGLEVKKAGGASHAKLATTPARPDLNLVPHAEELSGAPAGNFKMVAAQLQARRKVAAKLQAAYASFQALAEYNASGEFQQSLGDLNDAVQAYGRVTGSPMGLSAEAAAITGRLGGEILQADQARRLKRASFGLRKALVKYQAMIANDSRPYQGIAQTAINAHYQLVSRLWDADLLQGSTLVRDAAPEDGLALAGKPESFTSEDPVTDALVKAVLIARRDDAIAAIGEADAAHQKIIANLIAKHAAFEAGQPLSFDDLLKTAGELEAATEAIAKTRKEQ